MKLQDLATAILDRACPNGGVGEDDWNTFVIETHCIEWRITAKKIDGLWTIREVDFADC